MTEQDILEIEGELRIRLSHALLDRYLPLVFNCHCEGEHPTCASALAAPATIIQGDLVRSISKWLLTA